MIWRSNGAADLFKLLALKLHSGETYKPKNGFDFMNCRP